jgi:hypothetical protein
MNPNLWLTVVIVALFIVLAFGCYQFLMKVIEAVNLSFGF